MRVHEVCEACDAVDCHYHSIPVYIAPTKLRVPELVRAHLIIQIRHFKTKRGRSCLFVTVFVTLSNDQYVKIIDFFTKTPKFSQNAKVLIYFSKTLNFQIPLLFH